jgi:penicillin-binding protein 1A
MDRQSAFLTVSLLRNVVTGGTGIRANQIGQWVAGKTGTTNDSYDAWFMGFTRHLVTGVWVGHDKKERPLGIGEEGGRTAAPIWVNYVSTVLMDHTKEPPERIVHGAVPRPYGVIGVNIDPDTGLRARPDAPRAVMEYYRSGSEPSDYTPDKRVFSPDDVDVWDADTPL